MSDSKTRLTILPHLFACFILVFVVFFVFSGALKNGFLGWDDLDFVQNNRMIQSLNPHNLWKMATNLDQFVWHPLTWLSHAIDYQIFQLNPAGHHFTSIVLHCFNAVWVFVLFLRLSEKNVPSSQAEPALIAGGIIAALLFGLHPLRVESVVWVSDRKDLLCAFFVLATYNAYLSYVSATDTKSRQSWYVAALFLMLFALMSKSIAVTIPLVLLLLDIYPLGRWSNFTQGMKVIVEKYPFFALSLLVGVTTLNSLAHQKEGVMVPIATMDLTARVVNACGSVLFYIGKTLWPIHLVPIYPLAKNITLSSGWSLLSVISVFGISIACVWMWRKNRLLLPATWFYYLITLFPIIGIIQVGRQSAADRYTYLPTLGFYLLIGLGVAWLWRKNYRSIVLLCSVIILLDMGYLTIRQTEIWKDSETFWSYIAESYPTRLAVADYGLGKNYQRKGMLKEAEERFKVALTSDPEYIEALNALGLLHEEQGLYAEAEREYRKALKISPKLPTLHNNLGLLYIKTNQRDKAKAELLEAHLLDPNNAETHSTLAILNHIQGQFKDAEREYKTALAINPYHVTSHLNLGILYKDMGLLNQAVNEFKWGLYPEKYQVGIHSLLGEVYLKTGLKVEAEAEFREAQELCRRQAGGNPETKCTPYH